MSLKLMNTPPLWKTLLRANFTSIEALADFLDLSAEQKEKLVKNPRFVLNVPRRLAEKMEKGNLDDPLFKQFVPLNDELKIVPHYGEEPVQDTQFRKAGKLLQKYQGRALILCTSACVMHCRFCFRQNFPYETAEKTFEEEIEIIRNDPSIHEVILSGGDPLSLSNTVLDELFCQFEGIPHLTRIRFHTRFPIGIPERIDEDFVKILRRSSKQMYFVLHINHPNEVDDMFFQFLKPLQKMGCVLLNQAVLLRGINDTVEVLKTLCERLVDQGILPYYLHQLDRVRGAAHFEVEESKGRELVTELAKKLPGFAVPKYVREIPGEPNKTLL